MITQYFKYRSQNGAFYQFRINPEQPGNVSNLTKGNYIISLGINGRQPINKMFVKN